MRRYTAFENFLLIFLGLFLAFYAALSYFSAVSAGYIQGIFWVCYFGLFIIGIGTLIRRGDIILSQMYILFVPDIFWNIDFYYRLFTGRSLFGLTDYFFADPVVLIPSIISLQHLFIIPVGVFILIFVKVKKKNFAWLIALVEVMIFFILTRLFTIPEININCVYEPCVQIPLTLPIGVVWVAIYVAFIAVGYFFFKKFRFIYQK